MKVIVDFEDGTEKQEIDVVGADKIISEGAWVTLRFRNPSIDSESFEVKIWDRDDNPVVINKPTEK